MGFINVYVYVHLTDCIYARYSMMGILTSVSVFDHSVAKRTEFRIVHCLRER